MIPLAKLKEDIQFAQDLNESIELLKGVAVSQLHHFQSGHMRFDPYHGAMDRLFKLLEMSAGQECRKSIFFNKDESLPKLVVGITSDEGFLGEQNQMVIQNMMDIYDANRGDKVVVLGSKGGAHFAGSGIEATELAGVGEEVSREHAHELRDHVISRYSKREVGEVIIVYPYAKNIAMQEVIKFHALPLKPIKEMAKKEKKPFVLDQELICEPRMDRVIQYLSLMWIGEKIWDAFWLSKISEQFARITHLEGSMEEIKGLNSKLKREYFHHVHALSDKNIREIFASRTLWK